MPGVCVCVCVLCKYIMIYLFLYFEINECKHILTLKIVIKTALFNKTFFFFLFFGFFSFLSFFSVLFFDSCRCFCFECRMSSPQNVSWIGWPQNRGRWLDCRISCRALHACFVILCYEPETHTEHVGPIQSLSPVDLLFIDFSSTQI